MRKLGLTRERMVLANSWREWTAALRVRRVIEQLLASGLIPSINHIRKVAACHWMTAKKVWGLTLDHIRSELDKVHQAYRSLVLRSLNKQRDQPSGDSISSKNEIEPAEKPTKTDSLQNLQQRCLALARRLAGQTDGREKVPRAVENLSKIQLSIKFQKQLEQERADRFRRRGDFSRKLTPLERARFLQRTRAPGAWNETKAGFDRVFKIAHHKKEQECRIN